MLVPTHTDSETQGPVPAPKPGPATALNPLASVRKHWKLALISAFLVVMIGLPVAWVLGSPKYSSTAVIFVSPRFLANLEGGREQELQSNSQYREYVQQNVRTINRFDILLEALKRTGGRNSFWVRPDESLERSAERLQEKLVVQPVPDTYQITVTLESSQRAGLSELVNAIANTYLEKVKSEEFFASDERIHTLERDRDRLQQEIEANLAERMKIAQELGTSGFGDGYTNPFDRGVGITKEALAEARRARIQADAALAAFDSKQRPEAKDALHAYAFDQASKNATLSSLLSHLNIRRAQVLAAIDGLGPDHPGRRAADRELADIERQRKEASDKLVDSYSQMLLDQRRADAYKARQVEEKLASEMDRQTSQASWFASKYQQGIQLGLDMDRARKRLEALQQRIDFLALEKNAPGFVRLFTPARTPDLPSKGGRKKIFALFCGAALVFALVLPVSIDMLDPRIHSLRDVEGVLGFQPISWVMEKREAGPEFAREQILRLANRFSQEQQNNGSKIFAFTSVKARGGTSTLVTETARSLARLGVPALAVEANAYRADPRYRKPNARGLTVLLSGHQELRESVLTADAELPDRIPVGEIGGEKNLPDIQNLIEVLRQAATMYELILVDLPPILVSVDAEYIARVADVVVLVVEAETVTRGELRRAAASLERLKVSAISTVLNRVRADAGDGFARNALTEFQTGVTEPPPKWSQPWLWT